MQNLVIKITNDNGNISTTANRITLPENQLGPYTALLERLITAVQANASKDYGLFDDAHRSDFHQALHGHCFEDSSSQDSSFEAIEQALLQQLPIHFNGAMEDDDDHYLWLSQAGADKTNPIGIFLMKHEAGFFFGDTLQLMQTQCIEPSKVKYAAIIDPLQWEADSNRYITLKAPKAAEGISGAFQQMLAFTAGVDRKADTEEILQMVEQYTNEIVPDQKKDVASRVFQYCTEQDRQGQSVNVQELSEFMDAQAPDAFVQYVANALDTPRDDWHPDRRQIQRHTSFFGRDQNISIRFSSLLFGDDIVYDERTNSLTIKQLPKSLISQIRRYMKKSG